MELRVCSNCRQVHPGRTTCPGCRSPLTLADETLFLGETFGKYRVEAVLGSGGMGVVYRALHSTLQRPAALKIVLPQLDEDTFQKRFLREAQVLADLKHPNIVEVYDFDVSAWGSPYYVMEYLEGATLGALLRVRSSALPLGAASAVLADVGAGLAFAHRKGVVHRDLKPDNLFVADFDGRAVTKILDFGIAKVLVSGDQATRTHLTATGAVVGTPNYLAPEQLLGKEVGPWTDQYAVALIVAEVLSGRPVRAGLTLGDILREEIARPLAPERLPPALPRGMAAALARATEPDAAARFSSVATFLEALGLPAPVSGATVLTEAVRAAMGIGSVPTQAVLAAPTQTMARASASPEPPVEPTLAPAASEPAGFEPTPPRRSRRRVVIALLVMVLVALGVLGRVRRGRRAAGREAGASQALLVHRRDVAVPPDVTRVLTWRQDTLVLAGGGALYLLLADGSQPATRVPFGGSETLLGPGPEGDVWLLDGRSLLRLDPLKQVRAAVATLPAFPPADGPSGPSVVVSVSGRWAALLEPTAIAVCEVGGGSCKRRFAVPSEGSAAELLSLTDTYLVVARPGRSLDAYRLPDGDRAWSTAFREMRVHDLAVLDDADLLAVGGWFDHVDVHEMKAEGRSVSLPRRGQAMALAWIPDEPTLVVAGAGGIALARRGAGEVAAWGTGSHEGTDVLVTGAGLASLDARRHVLSVLDYAGLPAPRRFALSKAHLWAMAAEPEGERMFAGASDGVLHAFDLRAGRAEAFPLHTDGITDLAAGAGHLASTSDDKTIAVWKLPEMNVVWRSKAHGFLVNQLSLQPGDPPALWSSSSDGTVKRWAWPQIEEQESVDARALLGRRYSLGAIWADPSGDRVLAGTFNHALLALRRRLDGKWNGRALPVASEGTYRAAALPAVEAVLFTGTEPHGVYVYDTRADRLHVLGSLGQVVYFAVTRPGGKEALVFGDGVVLRYAFEREATGRLSYGVSARLRTDMGIILSAALAPGDTVAAGTDDGALLLLGARDLAGPTLVRAVLP
ncbi:MAG: protein kinase [Acidobacteria bacterium]|nr:protein kinase [Acidobacteriota bacterium]